ncbi:glutathione S-transferase [Roseibium sp. HPY-6]|uniref:glutathione S-transferase n=1 Tax=Roseibium sp. HPY-6 TaxID=3229852 RepID=UPI00338E3D54
MSVCPILYSFRRCPYAIRARLAIAASGQVVELREIVLRDKAPDFLNTSPTATVPCLKLDSGVLDESLEIMQWALELADPENWLQPDRGGTAQMLTLIAECDGPFKTHLDRYKYSTRYPDAQREKERSAASRFLVELDTRLKPGGWLFGGHATIADFAILPFVRQFANSDRPWFDAQNWQNLKTWLESFEASNRFQSVMPKWKPWRAGDEATFFPPETEVVHPI